MKIYLLLFEKESKNAPIDSHTLYYTKLEIKILSKFEILL